MKGTSIINIAGIHVIKRAITYIPKHTHIIVNVYINVESLRSAWNQY